MQNKFQYINEQSMSKQIDAINILNYCRIFIEIWILSLRNNYSKDFYLIFKEQL